jgi:hypothetical protein
MRRTLIVPGLLVLLLAAPLDGKTAFSGTYSINGNNPGVGAYKGTLTIVPRDGDVFDVHWAIGNLQYTGVGLVVNDTLSVAYSGGDRSWLGVIAYRQRADGSLEGKWAVQGRAGKPGTETAVRK